MNDTCPVCLDPLNSNENLMCMPVCMHRVHTKCALKAAQYDIRCPICRTQDPEITSKQEEDAMVYTNLERLAHEYDRHIRTYNRRRARMIRKHSRLARLRDQVKHEKKMFEMKERELEREWFHVQRVSWKNHPEIVRLKNERRKMQRRTSALCKRLEGELEAEIGPRPDDLLFHIR